MADENRVYNVIYHFYLGGAMRLPCKPDETEKTHFLTDFYNTLFKLQLTAFSNHDKHAFLKFYNKDRQSIESKKFIIKFVAII